MRSLGLALLVTCFVASVGGAQEKAVTNRSPSTPAAQPQRIGTMSELMVHMIYPTSDAVFYISSRTPKTDAEWAELQAKTLTLAESANLLMMPGRARDQDRWMHDARLMLDAGWAAFKAAKAKDVAALEALSDQLYESCVTCHKNYRPDYGKPKPPR
jgi:cytochrome c556